MEKTYLKLALIFLLSTIACCVTNDVNSPLVRFWNDGFIYTEKEEKRIKVALGKLIKLILPRH